MCWVSVYEMLWYARYIAHYVLNKTLDNIVIIEWFSNIHDIVSAHNFPAHNHDWTFSSDYLIHVVHDYVSMLTFAQTDT